MGRPPLVIWVAEDNDNNPLINDNDDDDAFCVDDMTTDTDLMMTRKRKSWFSPIRRKSEQRRAHHETKHNQQQPIESLSIWTTSRSSRSFNNNSDGNKKIEFIFQDDDEGENRRIHGVDYGVRPSPLSFLQSSMAIRRRRNKGKRKTTTKTAGTDYHHHRPRRFRGFKNHKHKDALVQPEPNLFHPVSSCSMMVGEWPSATVNAPTSQTLSPTLTTKSADEKQQRFARFLSLKKLSSSLTVSLTGRHSRGRDGCCYGFHGELAADAFNATAASTTTMEVPEVRERSKSSESSSSQRHRDRPENQSSSNNSKYAADFGVGNHDDNDDEDDDAVTYLSIPRLPSLPSTCTFSCVEESPSSMFLSLFNVTRSWSSSILISLANMWSLVLSWLWILSSTAITFSPTHVFDHYGSLWWFVGSMVMIVFPHTDSMLE